MFGAIARGSTGNDLSAFGDKALQRPHVFVIDGKGLVSTKPANFASSTRPPASAGSAFAIASATLTTMLVSVLGRG